MPARVPTVEQWTRIPRTPAERISAKVIFSGRAGVAHDSADWAGWEAASARVTIADRYQHFSFTIA